MSLIQEIQLEQISEALTRQSDGANAGIERDSVERGDGSPRATVRLVPTLEDPSFLRRDFERGQETRLNGVKVPHLEIHAIEIDPHTIIVEMSLDRPIPEEEFNEIYRAIRTRATIIDANAKFAPGFRHR